MSVIVRRLESDDWQLYRDIRLAALADAPSAFGSTHAEELAFDETAWRSRLDNGAIFVAFEDQEPVGLIGGRRSILPLARDLVSMWVDDRHRGTTVATQLVDAVVQWAKDDGAEELLLCCVDENVRAAALYRKVGFRPTGVSKQLRSDPSKNESQYHLRLR